MIHSCVGYLAHAFSDLLSKPIVSRAMILGRSRMSKVASTRIQWLFHTAVCTDRVAGTEGGRPRSNQVEVDSEGSVTLPNSAGAMFNQDRRVNPRPFRDSEKTRNH